MFVFLIIFHVIVCLVLIATILLQAGRGGGLTEAFGAGSGGAQSLLGTQAPLLLKRATAISAIAFLVTSLALGMVTARRGRSLFESTRFPVLPVSPQTANQPQAAPKASSANIPQPLTGELPAEEGE